MGNPRNTHPVGMRIYTAGGRLEYVICPACGRTIDDDDAHVDTHGDDVHAECCDTCRHDGTHED